MNSDERLGSWKEIGAYLQRDARTARRWEKEEGLPVHRHAHKSRSSVYAYPSEIDAWRAGRRVAPEPGPAIRPWWRPLVAGVTAFLCLVMVGNGVRPQVVLAQQSTPVARQVWAGDGVNGVSSVSPDGKYLSFRDPSTGALVIRDLQSGANRRVTATGGSAAASIISADSRQVAYAWRDAAGKMDLRILALEGAEIATPRVVYRNDQITVLEPSGWTPDGRQLLVRQILADRTGQLAIVNIQDGTARILKSFRWGTLDGHASLSPDGRFIAYGAANDKGLGQNLYVLSVDGSRERRITEGSVTDFMAQWSADGSQVFFVSDRTGDNLSLWSVPVQEGQAKGPAAMIKADTGDLTLVRPALRDGGLYYVADEGQKNIYVADLNDDLKAVEPPVLATQRFINSTSGGSWSPDGQYLAFYRTNYITGNKLVIQTLKTGAEREVAVQLRIPPYPSVAPPQWFPGGRSVLVVSYDERGIGYHRVDLQTGDSELLHRTKAPNLALAMAPVLSPDGKTIFYRDADGPNVIQLLRLDLEGRRETELKRSAKGEFLSSLALSPDGAQLAYGLYDDAAKSTALEAMPASGGAARKVHEFPGESDFSLGWSPDQHYLLFSTIEAAGRQTMWKVPVSGGEPEKLFDIAATAIYHPQFQPGSHRMVFGTIQNAASELWALENFLPRPTKGQ